ncbi:FG-GAP-like repeat-containing protein [Rhodopirellula sp. MGV]|uniref:FG-GAP-like repeat-containing protein n=1 Tax=Rhodopirellula sp. MGV TaxID=2023130 RepID=UPI000B9667B9|nr:FG-GAP-like repeat-containing protein [Rhodopirellula sp. MGV]OYP36966.1 hypothetical protein CGZ80_06275 [Rhodopirellula sp. MGV]PNY36272.1 hypothetical protein C2E31_14315 [Rhodopirellula baltica]
MKVRIQLYGSLMVLACIGCGSGGTDPTAAELLRKQQKKETIEATSGRTAADRIVEAESFLRQRNYVEAERVLRPLLVDPPVDPKVLLIAAKCQAAGGDLIPANALVDQILPETPAIYIQAMIDSSEWLTAANQFELAEGQLTKAIPIAVEHDDPRLNTLRHRLAALLNNQGKRIEAATYLWRLAKSGEITEKELFALNTLSDAFVDTTLPKPEFGQQLVPAALAVAQRYRADRKLDQAARLTEQLYLTFPDSTAIAAFFCRLMIEMNHDDSLRQLLPDLKSEIVVQPSYWYSAGVLLQHDNQHREAARCLLEAVKLDPTDPQAFLALSRSLDMLEKSSAATASRESFERLTEAAQIVSRIGLRPGTHDELFRLAELLDSLGRQWEAIAWLEIDQKLRPNLEETSTRIADLRRKAEHSTNDSIAGIENAIGIDAANWTRPEPETIAALLNDRESDSGVDVNREVTEREPEKTVDIVLDDVASQVGLDFSYDSGNDPAAESHALHQLTGGGIAAMDYDLDGAPDLYFVQGGGEAFDPTGSRPNVLMRNLDGKRWTEVSLGAGVGDRGYGQGATAIDVNQDGFVDIALSNIGPNVFYRNNGDGSFSREVIDQEPLRPLWTSSILAGDLDGDGLPELVEVNYVDDPTALTTRCTPKNDICNPSGFKPALDRVWHLTNDGQFQIWDGCLEMDQKPNFGFGGVIANFDGVAGNDVFIANDTEANHFWLSENVDRDESGGGSFRLSECAPILGCAFGVLGQRNGCMGVASGDFDRNGSLDLHVTNFWNQSADLFLQQDGGLFANGAAAAGIYEPTRLTVGWGTQAVDFDRDGFLDLAVLNGNLVDHRWKGRPFQMLPQFFRGDGDRFNLETPVGDYWSKPTLGRIMATLDWNLDGKVDLVLNHLDQPVALLENQTLSRNGVQFRLIGTDSERDANGAKLTIECGTESWTGWLVGGDGMLCTNEPIVDFGIAGHDQVDRAQITWPSGYVQELKDLDANRCYTVIEGQGIATELLEK